MAEKDTKASFDCPARPPLPTSSRAGPRASRDKRSLPPPVSGPDEETEFAGMVGRKETRKLRARREKERTAWFWVGLFGLVGWSVSLPTLVGVALGVWIDRRWPSPVSWTLSCLFVGVAVGCLNAWYWVRREFEELGSDEGE